MSNRLALLDHVRGVLARAGYAVSERCAIRPVSFDVVARRDGHLLIVKVLTNIDAFDRRVSQEMQTLAKFLEGTALLVGDRSGSGPLEDGVVYAHHGVYAVSHATLAQHVLEDAPPYVVAAPGGLYVSIETTTLRTLRAERHIPLGALAEQAGVSRRTIQMYEKGMRATLESALRLEEFLGTALVEPVDPFSAPASDESETADEVDTGSFGALERDVFSLLEHLGFQVVPTTKSPFAALSRESRSLVLTGINEEDRVARRKARIMRSIQQVTERSGVFVVRKETVRTQLEGTPVVSRDELRKMDSPDALHDVLRQREQRAGP